jgi:hypothetical protein
MNFRQALSAGGGATLYRAGGRKAASRVGDKDVSEATTREDEGAMHAREAPAVAGDTLMALQRPARRPVECGDLPFLIRRDGTWLYRGSPIGRKELVCLFASVLLREADGSFWLQTPAERGRIEVEDAPFVAVEMDWTGCGRNQTLTFRTNVDEVLTAGPDHPIRIAHDILTCEPTPYIRVRGTPEAPLEARIARPVYYELVALAEPGMRHCRKMLGVWSRGIFFPLGELPNGEA